MSIYDRSDMRYAQLGTFRISNRSSMERRSSLSSSDDDGSTGGQRSRKATVKKGLYVKDDE